MLQRSRNGNTSYYSSFSSPSPPQPPGPCPAPAPRPPPFTGFSDDTNPNGPPARDIPLIEKPFAQLSDQHLDDLGKKALAIRPADWKHAETDNFIIHYRRATEAAKVAREVEYDLWFVATSLGATKDRYSKKSHVFVFQDENEWRVFLATTSVPSWAVSFAHADNLFLNLRDAGGSNVPFDEDTLAHETTHAVVARLYPGDHWPLWLNEGFAEYMAGASIAARKNQPIRRHQHTLTFASMSLDDLQKMDKYPDDPVQVAQLYETAEKLVRFIMTTLPRDRFTQFIASIAHGATLSDTLLKLYPDHFTSYDDFQKQYARFSK